MERVAWVGQARRKIYPTQRDWVSALQEMGWDGINLSTIGTWEASGFLPTSLDYRALNLVARSLQMTPNEVLRRQGIEIVGELEGDIIPSPLMNFIQEARKEDKETLEIIMPLVEQHFRMLCDHMKNHQPK